MNASLLSAYLGLSPYRVITQNDNLISSRINKINLKNGEISITFKKIIMSKTFIIEVVQNEKLQRIRAQTKKVSSDGLTFVLKCEAIDEGKFDKIYYAKNLSKVSLPTINVNVDSEGKKTGVLGEFSVNLVGDNGVFIHKDESLNRDEVNNIDQVDILLDGLMVAKLKPSEVVEFGLDFLYLKGDISHKTISILSSDESTLINQLESDINNRIRSGLIIC